MFNKYFIERKFSLYKVEYHKLKKGFFSNELKYYSNSDPPYWKRYHLIKAMDAIVKAEDQGYILKDDLNWSNCS